MVFLSKVFLLNFKSANHVRFLQELKTLNPEEPKNERITPENTGHRETPVMTTTFRERTSLVKRARRKRRGANTHGMNPRP